MHNTTYCSPEQRLQEESLKLLNQQKGRGADFYWMLTFHYRNPAVTGWGTKKQLHNGSINGMTKLRVDSIHVSKDAKHIRNLLLRSIWGVKRLDLRNSAKAAMIFFHEKGQGIQYHTHLLIGKTPPPCLTVESIETVWKQKVLPKAKFLSRTNTVDVRAVHGVQGAFDYLTKEIALADNVIDCEASCLLRPLGQGPRYFY